MLVSSYRNLGTARRGYRAFAALAGKANGFVLDLIDDIVLVRDAITPANNFCGTMAQALAAGILVYSSPSTKYVRNSAGILVPGTTLRCHYSVAGVPLGVLPEPQRANLLLRSCEIDNTGVWANPGGSTITPNATAAPDGTTTADLWVPPAASATYTLYQNVTVTAAATYTASIYMKKSGLLTGGTFYWREDAEDALGMTINLSTMTVNTGNGSIKDAGNGWYRLITGGAVAGTSWRPQIRWAGPNAGGAGVYLWGAQLEAGLFETSFIKTEGSQVTRNADNLYVDLTKVPFGAEYTVIAHAQPSPDSATNGHVLYTVGDNTVNERHRISNGAPGGANLTSVWRTSNVEQASLTATGSPTASAFKVATATKADDFQFVVNGTSRGTDTSGTIPVSPTRLMLGHSYLLTTFWSAPIGFIALIPERLSQADMIARTS